MISQNVKESIYFSLLRFAGLFSLGILLIVIGYIVKLGIGVIDLKFLTQMWQHRDITRGGIFPAILGTFYLGIGVAIFSIPVGISCAVYLNEYAQGGRTVRMIRLAIRNLAGVPSIVYGLFGFAVFVQFLNFGTSLLAASLTLSCMTLPWVITASEEALKAVPTSFREGALALGATKWQTIRTSVLPYAIPGMITGSILGLARAMGETAPIIVVGATFYMAWLPASPFDKFMALPYHLFILATQHAHPLARAYAAGTALVLVALIFGMTLFAMLIRYYYRKRKEW
jgi:phosphate transport system permease protein